MANIDAGINSLLLEKILRDMQAAQGAPVKRLSIDEINQSMKRTTPEKKKKIKKKPIKTTLPTRIDKNAKPLDPLGLKRTALDNRLYAMGNDPLTWLKQQAMQNIQTVKPADESLNRYGYATAEQNIKQKKQVDAPYNEKFMNPGNSTAGQAAAEFGKTIGGAGAFIDGNLAKGLLVNQVEGMPTTAAGVRAWFQNLVGDKEGSKNTLDMVDNPDAPLVYDANGKQRPYKETGGNYLYVQDGKKWKLVPYKAGDQGKFYTKASGMFGDIYSKYDGQGSIELQKGNDLITQGLNQMQGNEVYDKLNETGAGGIMLKDILQGVGEQGWNAAFQAVAPGAGYAIMGVNSAGNKIRERADQGDRDINNIMANAGLSGAATALIEKTSGGLGGFGKTNPVVRAVTKNIKSVFVKNGIKVAGNVIGESTEEVEDAFVQGVIDYFLNNKENKTIAQLFADNKPLEAAISAAIISGLTLGGSGVNATTNGVDIETGLTNEQTKFVEGLAKSQKNEKGKSIGFDKAVEVYQKNKALESQIGFTPDFDEQAVAPEDAKNIPLRFTQTGNKRVDDFNVMQAKVLKNTPEDRNQAYNNIRTVMELGIDEFILSDKEVQQMNKPAGTGAFWNEKLNAVVVNAETKRSFASKLFHEFAHIRENSSVQSELANMVIAYRNANPTTLKDGTTETAEQEMARIKATYEKAGVQLNEQELRNEFVAEELARLSDKDAKFYQSVFEESPTVFQRLGQYVQKKLGFLKEGSEEQQYFKKIQELQKKAYDEVKYQRKQKQDANNNSDKNLIEDNEAKSIKDKAEKMFKAANIKEVKRPAIKDVKDLTVYHGSSATDIKQFDFEKAGRNTRSGEKGIVYFTENRQLAKDMFAFERISTDSNFYDKIGAKGTVYESKITMNKPLDLRNLSVKEAMMIAENDPNKMATPEMVLYLSKVPNGQMLKPLINVEAYKKEGYDGIIADMDKNGNIEYGVFSNEQINIVDDKYLIEDNLGRELSKGQQEFFKDSKVRDEEGRLLRVYHGTANSGRINVFEGDKLSNRSMSSQIGQGFYFTNVEKEARSYLHNVDIYGSVSFGRNPYLHEVYLDIKNPFIVWSVTTKKHGELDREAVKRVFMDGNYEWFFSNHIPHQISDREVNGRTYTRSEIEEMGKEQKVDLFIDYEFRGARRILSNMVHAFHYNNQNALLESMKKHLGYDGIVEEFKPGMFQYVALSPNQIKSIDNLNPTEDDDIRYLIEDPRLDGDFSNTSDRATKSMVKQFPELAPYLKEMAGYMQMEVEGGFRDGRSVAFDYNGDAIQTGGKRFVIADDIASILDSKIIKSYAHLSETLQDIQNGEGWNAAAKYLEMYLDERLTNGYTTDGMDIPPNEAYVGMKEMLKKGIVDNTIDGQLPYTPDKWNEYEPTGKNQAEYEAMQGLAPIRKEPSQKDVDEYAEMQGLVPIREDLKPNKFTAMKESSARALSELEKARDTIISDYNQKINQAKIELHKKKRLSKQRANLQARIIRLEKMRDDRIAEFDARINRQEKQVEKRTETEEEQQRIENGKKLRQEFTELAEKYTDTLDENFRERRGIFVGLRYIGSTTERNIDRVSVNREIAKGLKEDYVKKDDRAYELSLEDKLYYKGKLETYNLNDTESKYAAMYWEIKHNPKTTINPDSVKSFYAQHKSKINQAKVDAFLETAFEINEVLFNRMNEVRIKTGRKPIPRLEGHMPHFNLDIMKGGVWDIAQLFGLEVQRDGLPTSIAGKTENFKPIAPFNKFAQRRTGDKTEYNILKAMDMYIDKAVEEIYFTESVMRWRHLENSFRSKYDPKGLEKEIENIKNNEDLDEMQILDKIESARDEFYKNNSSEIQYPHLVTWIMDYANNLANKTNPIVDRLMERLAGRHVNSFIEGLNSIAVKNMLTSFGTAISQIVPVVNALSTYGEVNMIKGITQMLMEEAVQIKAYLEDAPYEYRVGMMGDSVMNKSSFAKTRLTKRVRLGDTTRNKISDKAFEMTSGGVDGLVTNLVIRAGYNKGLSRGYTEEQAIAYADESSRAMMQDRSKVHAPLLFQSKALRFLTNFQIEPLNDILYAIYDSRKYAGGDDDDKLGALTNYLIRYIVMSYLINAFSKSTKGSKVVLSPADIVIDSMKVLGNEDLSSVEKTARVASVFTDQLPFSYILDTFFAIDTSGARIALQSMVPGWRETGDAIADLNDDNKDNDAGAKYNLYKEWSKPLYYLLMPAFGGQIKKSIEGIGQYYEITDKGIENREVPGSYTAGGDLRYEVPDTPEAKGQALLFGQYSSSGAREYFDTGAKPTSVDTIKAAKEADLAPTEYKKIKKKAQEIDTNKDGRSTYEEKLNYLESLDIPVDSKTAIANDLAPTREYKVDMKEYDKMSGLEEYDLYLKDRGQWEAITNITNYMHYKKIESNIEELTSVPEMENESTSVRAQAVYDYVMSTNLDYDKKLMLIKSKYSNYNYSTAKKYEPYIAELDKVVLDSIDSMKISKEAKKSLASKYKFKYFEWRGYGW